MARRGVVRFEADLDARDAGLREPVDAGREDVAGQAPSLVVVLRAHGFDEARGRRGVVPEQTVRGDLVVTVEDEQIEVRAIERRLTKARLNLGSAPTDQVVRTRHRVEASGQSIVVVQPADLRSGIGRQPRLDQPVPLRREAMAGLHRTHHVVRPVDLELDGSEAALVGVREPAPDDVRNPLGRGVGHDDRVESRPVAPAGRDDGRFGATEMIEPEELRDAVGRARRAPPPPEVGRLVPPVRGVGVADLLQQAVAASR